MSPRHDRLAALAALAGLMSDRAMGPVARAQARLDGARAEVGALAEARARAEVDAADPVQAALMARQAEGVRRRQVAAMTDLARLQAELEIAKAAARPAFGRKLALGRLQARMRDGR